MRGTLEENKCNHPAVQLTSFVSSCTGRTKQGNGNDNATNRDFGIVTAW